MSKKVYVVTNGELGWDNVVGVFDADKITKEELSKHFNEKYDYIKAHTVDKDLRDYE